MNRTILQLEKEIEKAQKRIIKDNEIKIQ